MKIIYSSDVIDGVEGVYANPRFFDKINKSATEVFTDNKDIAKAYKDADIKVSTLDKPKATKAK